MDKGGTEQNSRKKSKQKSNKDLRGLAGRSQTVTGQFAYAHTGRIHGKHIETYQAKRIPRKWKIPQSPIANSNQTVTLRNNGDPLWPTEQEK